jgi:hypothetical protein
MRANQQSHSLLMKIGAMALLALQPVHAESDVDQTTADQNLHAQVDPPNGEDVTAADAKFNDDLYSKRVEKLAEHLGLRTACPKLEKDGSYDPSTGMWYLGDSLRSWSKTYLEQFPDQESFPDRAFEKTFARMIKEKHGHFLFAPKSAEQLAKAFSNYFKDEQFRIRNEKSIPGSAREFLKSRGKGEGLSAVYAALSEFNKVNQKRLTNDKRAMKNCSAERSNYKFWQAPTFATQEIGHKGDANGLARKPVVDHIKRETTPKKGPSETSDKEKETSHSAGTSERIPSASTTKLMQAAASIERSMKGTGRCATAVKYALSQAGCMNYKMCDAYNCHVNDVFRNQGFQEVRLDKIKNLDDIPEGSVLIYSGGQYGHIELKTSKGYSSDYFSEAPRTGSSRKKHGNNRTLAAVYIKPSCGAGKLVPGTMELK